MLLEIIAPVILIVGLFGNIINLYVFTRPVFRSKGLSTFRFLAYLSVVDLLYLLIGLSHIMVIVYTGYDYRTYSNFVCSFHSFLTLYLSHLSSNVLAGVSVFRCVTLTRLKPVKPVYFNGHAAKIEHSENPNEVFAVYSRPNKPLWQRFKTNFGQADAFVLCIMLVLFAFDFHYLIWMRLSVMESFEANFTAIESSNNSSLDNDSKVFYPVTYNLCHPNEKSQQMYFDFLRNSWIWIDLFLYSYIPFTVMIVCTALIIYRLYKITKNLKSKTKTKATDHFKQKEANDPLISNNSPSSINPNNGLITTPSTIDIKNVKLLKGTTQCAHSEQAKKTVRKNGQIYKLLLTVNIFFFALVTPLVLANSLDLLGESNHIFRDLVYTLAYLNHALNFLFYGFSCKIYRMILIDFVKSFFSVKSTK